MTALKAHEVARYLDRPDLSEGIFLAYGPDAGLVRETARRLARRLMGPDPESAELVTLEADEIAADPSRLAVEARTQSLFGLKRVIRVRGADKSLTTTLSPLVQDPAGAVIVLEAGNLPPRDALRALVEAAPRGRALPCYADSEETLSLLIRETFSQASITLEPDALAALRDSLGNDREITRRELEKLVLHAGPGGVLTRETVLTLCADNAALVLDAILDAAGTGHAGRLDAHLDRALRASIDPQRILAVALAHFAALRRWRVEVDAGRTPRDVLNAARPRPHFSRSAALEQQLRLWTDSALANACDRLLRATEQSRRRPVLAETLLRRALLGLTLAAATH